MLKGASEEEEGRNEGFQNKSSRWCLPSALGSSTPGSLTSHQTEAGLGQSHQALTFAAVRVRQVIAVKTNLCKETRVMYNRQKLHSA
jgi:hypothetical protein